MKLKEITPEYGHKRYALKVTYTWNQAKESETKARRAALIAAHKAADLDPSTGSLAWNVVSASSFERKGEGNIESVLIVVYHTFGPQALKMEGMDAFSKEIPQLALALPVAHFAYNPLLREVELRRAAQSGSTPNKPPLTVADFQLLNRKLAGRPPIAGETATNWIQLRVTPERKEAYLSAAATRKLSEWIFEKLDQAANYSPAAGK